VATVGVSALASFAALPSEGASPKPNILIIVADDLGYADVGFNGGKVIQTPNLDRLAASGVNLTDFRACPMCSPPRAGLLTGRWPLRFGMMRAVVPPWSKHGLPSEEKTLPELLAGGGYERRGIIGKWHLGHARRQFLPLAQGFTFFYGHYNGAIDYFTHEREGERDWHLNDRSVREEGYSTDLLAEAAVRFVQESPVGKPLALTFHLTRRIRRTRPKRPSCKNMPESSYPIGGRMRPWWTPWTRLSGACLRRWKRGRTAPTP
jgi:arylsulfatase A-like enzyme